MAIFKPGDGHLSHLFQCENSQSSLRLGPADGGDHEISFKLGPRSHSLRWSLVFRAVYTPQVVHSWPVAKVEQSQQHRGEELDEKLQWDKLFHALRSGSNSWKTGTTDILPISSPSVFLCEEYWKGSGAHLFPWGTESKTASRDWQPQDANFLAIRDTITCGNSM